MRWPLVAQALADAALHDLVELVEAPKAARVEDRPLLVRLAHQGDLGTADEEVATVDIGGGVAGEITARITENVFEWLDAPILRVTAADVPLPYSPPLEDYVLPQTADIVTALRRLASY